MTSKQVGDIIGVTSMGARQHLTAMEKDDLVASEFVRQKAGRPALYFKLTEKADHYFPQQYGPLAMDILKGVESLEGRNTVEKVLEQRWIKLRQAYDTALNKTGTVPTNLKEKVEKLATIRDDDGYMSEMEEKDGELYITEHNCPIQTIAKEYNEVCQYELDLFQKLLNSKVVRVEHMINGERSCVYRVFKNSKPDYSSSKSSSKSGGKEKN